VYWPVTLCFISRYSFTLVDYLVVCCLLTVDCWLVNLLFESRHFHVYWLINWRFVS
jgi:hypothetical protein